MKRFPTMAALACMGLLTGGVAQAVNVNFTGKLVEQPDCVLNAGKDIAVNFDNVVVKKIDGVSYKKMEIPYSVSCTGGDPNSGQLKVMLDFVPVSWGDYNPLQSSIPNLGLRITQGSGDTTYVSKTKLSIDAANPTKLYAVPIGRPSAMLTGGDFTGSATMTVMYE
ncbi:MULTISPECIES: fimbrial protein [Serratia]|uniref:fimbrial protein n=1 Tax=Serratia TaxID=613 RepID=UPI000668CE27|nr:MULTISPECIES: fimbrial protein [Serratia]MBH2773382.1 fimbrial protein [Serratia marcescens]MCW6014376.1 fimbrial protein [Serratia marcescens]WEE05126.1 fimbrial protein [Serratia marcescens]WGL90951.1 fimbrial protein [Serratia marcescens]WJD88301.1 fimbrial protein [Serratia marcescens]